MLFAAESFVTQWF